MAGRLSNLPKTVREIKRFVRRSTIIPICDRQQKEIHNIVITKMSRIEATTATMARDEVILQRVRSLHGLYTRPMNRVRRSEVHRKTEHLRHVFRLPAKLPLQDQFRRKAAHETHQRSSNHQPRDEDKPWEHPRSVSNNSLFFMINVP